MRDRRHGAGPRKVTLQSGNTTDGTQAPPQPCCWVPVILDSSRLSTKDDANLVGSPQLVVNATRNRNEAGRACEMEEI